MPTDEIILNMTLSNFDYDDYYEYMDTLFCNAYNGDAEAASYLEENFS